MWTLALQNEINSPISQNVFENSEIDIRMNADGTVNKYKALVSQGNYQDVYIFFDTFADTASACTINILLSIAALKIWKFQPSMLKQQLYSP